MKTLTCILVDDEEKARDNLENLIKEYVNKLQIVKKCSNIAEASKAIDDYDPDIIFLDIEMNTATGFDLLEKLKDDWYNVIFVTAHDEYAVKAFRYSATDYLLKPIDIDELIESVEKIRNGQSQKEQSLEVSAGSDSDVKKLAVPIHDGVKLVSIDSIIRFEGTGNYTNVFTEEGDKGTFSKGIKHFEEMLMQKNFVRVHRSHLVNINFIKEYHKGRGGFIVLKDGTQLEVSRRRKQDLMDKMIS